MPTNAPAAAFADATASDGALRRFLHGLPGIDPVGLEARAASLGTRSIKTSAKAYAIDLAISMIDLTTLEGADTPGKVRALAAKAVNPDPTDRTTPHTAAVCVYPDMVATAKEVLKGSGRQGRVRRHRLPGGPRGAAGQARGRTGRGRGRRRRDRHGDRPGRVPGRSLPQGVRGDRGRPRRVRRQGPPQGHLRDRRAVDVRQHPPRQLARHDGRRRLHQDVDGQGRGQRHPRQHPRTARSRTGLPRPDRRRRSA